VCTCTTPARLSALLWVRFCFAIWSHRLLSALASHSVGPSRLQRVPSARVARRAILKCVGKNTNVFLVRLKPRVFRIIKWALRMTRSEGSHVSGRDPRRKAWEQSAGAAGRCRSLRQNRTHRRAERRAGVVQAHTPPPRTRFGQARCSARGPAGN
jgi:hypothetical protein